jgi:exopolysaccharide biosynthesis polyprenyl glycosylphosphotransferase
MNLFLFVRKLRIFNLLRKGIFLSFLLAVIDLFVLTIAYQISFSLVNLAFHKLFFVNKEACLVYLILLPIWVLLLIATNNNQIPRTSRYSKLMVNFLQFTVFNIIALELILLIIGHKSIGFSFVLVFGIISFVSLFLARLSEYKTFKNYRANGFNYINVAFVADGSSIPFIQDLIDKREWGYHVLLIFTDSKLVKAKFGDKVKVLPEGGLHTLKSLMEVYNVDEVFFFRRSIKQYPVNELIKWCEEVGVIFRFPSDISPLFLTTGRITSIGNLSFVTFTNIPTNPLSITWKNFFDFFGSLVILIMTSWLFIILAILIKFDSKGPVFFKQARVGLRGRQFYLYKFRTMVVNAEELKKKLEAQNEMDGPVFKIKNDPRITRIGGMLRKTGFDELPQLINVFKGEMSLIGPRPPLMSEVQKYKRWQLRRLSVKPGITCIWQIQPDRNSIHFEEWMELDLNYIDKWSPKLDILLLFKTIRTVIFGTGS